MPWVMHVRGYSYGGEEGPGEHIHQCYLTRDGQCSYLRAQARVYDTEAEAWEHLTLCGESPGTDEHGELAWTEEIRRSS